MKRFLAILISVLFFFSCTNTNENETDEDIINETEIVEEGDDTNLEEDLGELESELSGEEKDTTKSEQ